jgi:protein CpxP
MKIRTGFLSIALASALGLSAAAQSSTTTSPQSEPSSAAPAQSAPAPADSTQSSPTQNTSPAQSSPDAAPAQSAPSQSAPAQGNSGQMGASSEASPGHAQAQAQSESDNPLNLTDEQKAKLRPIVTAENQQMEALRNDTSLSQEQKVAKANQIREEASPKIKAILTPEQLQKLADLQQKARQNQGAAAPQK